MTGKSRHSLLDLTTTIVLAFVSSKSTSVESVPVLIREVHRTLAMLRDMTSPATVRWSAEHSQFSNEPRGRATSDYLVCLECGRPVTVLKRHLRAAHQLTPEAYRARWKLPNSYHMITEGAAATKSQHARRTGLGKKRPFLRNPHCKKPS